MPVFAPDYVIVLTTFPGDMDAAEFAAVLIREQLAACVNVQGDMLSLYRWQGELQRDTERQVVIKTTRDRLDDLWVRVRELHPYEVPEFLVLPVVDGSDAYLRWMREMTRPLGSAATAQSGDASQVAQRDEAADQQDEENKRG
jgi:periplasmic divalent cation tolerance protein